MNFRVSETEQQTILNIAQAKGLSTSEFLRELLSNYAMKTSEEKAKCPNEQES
jgi:predicted DNA binding CopG/RHH family protein